MTEHHPLWQIHPDSNGRWAWVVMGDVWEGGWARSKLGALWAVYRSLRRQV